MKNLFNKYILLEMVIFVIILNLNLNLKMTKFLRDNLSIFIKVNTFLTGRIQI